MTLLHPNGASRATLGLHSDPGCPRCHDATVVVDMLAAMAAFHRIRLAQNQNKLTSLAAAPGQGGKNEGKEGKEGNEGKEGKEGKEDDEDKEGDEMSASQIRVLRRRTSSFDEPPPPTLEGATSDGGTCWTHLLYIPFIPFIHPL